MLWLALGCAVLGLAQLALAQDRHWRQLARNPTAPAHAGMRRLLGWLGLAASLFACGGDAGWAIGLIQWCGVLSVASVAVLLVLAFCPALLRPFMGR